MLLRILITATSLVALLACMAMGLFSAAGVCAMVFGSEVLDNVLGDPPDRTHPAFILFVILMVPGAMVGTLGGLFGVYLPLHQRFRIPLGRRNEVVRKWLHAYATRLVRFTTLTSGKKEPGLDP